MFINCNNLTIVNIRMKMRLEKIVNKTRNYLSNLRNKLVFNTRKAAYLGLITALTVTAGARIAKAREHNSLQDNLNTSFVDEEQKSEFQPKSRGRPARPNNNLPKDTLFREQWYLHNINAPEAWKITTGDPNIVVAVLDNGVDYNHPDLFPNIWVNPNIVEDTNLDGIINIYDVDLNKNGSIEEDELNHYGNKPIIGWDFYDNNNSPSPLIGDHPNNTHGTACAGLIAAQKNKEGIVGVAHGCKIMPIRIMSGIDDFITDADIATAISWAAENGADVINCSWGGLKNMPIVHSAIKDVTMQGGIGREGKGCVVLAASGNDVNWAGYSSMLSLAKLQEVIAVGATNHNDIVWSYSESGPELEIVAPSGNWTTDIVGSSGYNNNYPNVSSDYTNRFSGTSSSCPIAAGTAALVLSANPNLTGLEVRRILLHSAQDLGDKGWDKYYGNGRVDAGKAVNMAFNPPAPLIFVDDNAVNDPWPGCSETSDPLEDGSVEHPFDSVQEAINKAVLGNTVIVLPGVYTGKNNRNIEFLGKPIIVRSRDSPENCIIDCQNLGRGFYFHRREVENSILKGLTITNGKESNGAGISCINKSNPTITNCIFTNNLANRYGGGIYNGDSSPTLINCTFSKNSAGISGGGMTNHMNEGTKVSNCIFWSNSPEEISLLAEGKSEITYSNIQGGWPGLGNINKNPLFADPNNGDYHLKSQAGRWDPKTHIWVKDNVTSPCIDAGNPGSPLEDELLNIPDDLSNGNHNWRINMGAYGGTFEASRPPYDWTIQADLTNDGIVNFKDFTAQLSYWRKTENQQLGDLNRDSLVDMVDFTLLTGDWLKQTSWYEL